MLPILIDPARLFFCPCWSSLICYEKDSPSKIPHKDVYVNVCVFLFLLG